MTAPVPVWRPLCLSLNTSVVFVETPGDVCRLVEGTDGVSQTYDGYLVGADRSKDLAVLKINAEKVLPYLRLPVSLCSKQIKGCIFCICNDSQIT